MSRIKNRIHNPRPGEYIILYIHRHWIVLFWAVLRFMLLATFPIILTILYSFQGSINWDGFPGLVLVLASSIYYLFIWLMLFNKLLDHFLDIWIVTNERIVNIEQLNLFSRNIAEKQLDKMQDITVITHGFFPTLFNYGDVYIQTAGSVERFIFRQVPNPKRISTTIMDAVERYRIKYDNSHSLKEYENKEEEEKESSK